MMVRIFVAAILLVCLATASVASTMKLAEVRLEYGFGFINRPIPTTIAFGLGYRPFDRDCPAYVGCSKFWDLNTSVSETGTYDFDKSNSDEAAFRKLSEKLTNRRAEWLVLLQFLDGNHYTYFGQSDSRRGLSVLQGKHIDFFRLHMEHLTFRITQLSGGNVLVSSEVKMRFEIWGGERTVAQVPLPASGLFLAGVVCVGFANARRLSNARQKRS